MDTLSVMCVCVGNRLGSHSMLVERVLARRWTSYIWMWLGSFQYQVLKVRDIFSQWLTITLGMSHKSDVPAAVKEIINFWETQQQMPIKAVRTDRGG